MRRTAHRLLGCLLLVQPLAILAQLVAARHWRGRYSLTRNTISDLGTVRCGTIEATYGPVHVCSPWHWLVNGSFVVLGSLLAIAGLLLLLRSTARVTAVLLVGSGLGSALVGLAPLDTRPGLHSLVATPVFVTQPLAVLAITVTLWGVDRTVAVVLGLLGLLAASGAIGFGLTLAAQVPGGVYERVGLWSCHLTWGVLGVAVLTGRIWSDRVWEDDQVRASR